MATPREIKNKVRSVRNIKKITQALEAVAANKMPGIRAGLCHDTYSAHQGVEHDDMNVLVIGARVIGDQLARELVTAFMKAVFSREERHKRRLEKIKALEDCYAGKPNKIR